MKVPIIRGFMQRIWDESMSLNKANILSLLQVSESAKLLDLGCNDGNWTIQLGKKIGTRSLFGVDVSEKSLKEAQRRGVKAKKGDLNKIFPFPDNFFDCVHANQVIEHLWDLDNFVKEINRVLRVGGYCIVSTENLASWSNICSLLLGWQPFSLANISVVSGGGLGNRFALSRGRPIESKSWMHTRVLAIRALEELFAKHGFAPEDTMGAGYFPLPAFLGRLEPTHSQFITIKARKIFR